MKKEILEKIVKIWGANLQSYIAAEECIELAANIILWQELDSIIDMDLLIDIHSKLKARRLREYKEGKFPNRTEINSKQLNNISEEMADVKFTLEQMEVILGNSDLVNEIKHEKEERVIKLLEKDSVEQ